MTDEQQESLLKFPCDFTIKVFGLASTEFEAAVYMIIRKYVPNMPENAIQSRASENGKYTALSITIHVESRAQLDDIYKELSASPKVIMAI